MLGLDGDLDLFLDLDLSSLASPWGEISRDFDGFDLIFMGTGSSLVRDKSKFLDFIKKIESSIAALKPAKKWL